MRNPQFYVIGKTPIARRCWWTVNIDARYDAPPRNERNAEAVQSHVQHTKLKKKKKDKIK